MMKKKITKFCFVMHVNIFVVCNIHKLIHTSYVTCTKITKKNDKRIELSLNPKH